MFESNFRDERYLPFKGAGVISEWNLEFPTEARQFDYNSISDVIITIRYTAKDSNDSNFKIAVNTKIKDTIDESVKLLNNSGGLFRLFSLKNDFVDEFHSIESESHNDRGTKDLRIGTMYFPFFTNGYKIKFKECKFFNIDGSRRGNRY